MNTNIPPCEPVSYDAEPEKKQPTSEKNFQQAQTYPAKVSRTRYWFVTVLGVIFEVMFRTLLGIVYGALGALMLVPIAFTAAIICGIIFGSIEVFTKVGAGCVISGGIVGFIYGACSDSIS